MPCVDVTLPRGKFDSAEQEALVEELTRLIVHWESGTDRPGYDKAAWAFVHEVDLIAVGGRPRRPEGRQVYGSWPQCQRGPSTTSAGGA